MYSKKNILAVVGLLAAGVMGESSAPFPITTSTAVDDPTSTTAAMGHIHGNGTMATPVWSYFNVTVTSVVVVQELTTVCKEATTLTFNGCEYPATAGQVVVVTNCPCTVTKVCTICCSVFVATSPAVSRFLSLLWDLVPVRPDSL